MSTHIQINRSWLLWTAVVLSAASLGAHGLSFGGGAMLRVTSQPAGAKVMLDGQDQGITPVSLQRIDPGQHLLEVRKDDFQTQRRTVSLFNGEKKTEEFKLEPLKGLVIVQTIPAGAEADVDGAFRGKTPLLLYDLAVGDHSVVLRTEGYQTRKLALAIKDRVPQLLKTDLSSDSATVKISSEPVGASVLLNGATRGTTPCTIDRIPSGTVDIEIVLKGYEHHRSQIVLKAGDIVDVPAPLKAIPASLTVHSIPEQARIYVNNQFRGEAPIVLTNLPPGEFRLRAEKRGFESDARNITLKPEDQITEEFRLQHNSGGLVIITEPAGAKVFVDDEEAGTTGPSVANPQISEPLRVNYIGKGDHLIKLVKPGYAHAPIKITIDADNLITRTEHMKRLFIPDTIIRTGAAAEESHTGVLVRKFPNGSVQLEERPGILTVFEASQIKSIGPIGEKK
ncbi:MAG: PEGA domain-containing protein [Kiritimatiellaeota bacterium]|nr:PEGA domain-containing protein [Kiritimatiellota bacterium]